MSKKGMSLLWYDKGRNMGSRSSTMSGRDASSDDDQKISVDFGFRLD